MVLEVEREPFPDFYIAITLDVIGIDLSRDTIFAIMIHEDELPAFMEEVRRRALLACDNKPEYVRALRESPTWYRFGNGEIGYRKNTGYRYDFFEKPNEFRELMMQNKIAAYLSDRRQGCSNLIDHLPLLTFKNENVEGEYLHFYCIEDIVQRR